MGWGIYVQMYLSKVTPAEVPGEIEAVEEYLTSLRERILMYAAATPPIPTEDGDVSIDTMHANASALLNEYAEESVKLATLHAYQDAPDEAEVDPPA